MLKKLYDKSRLLFAVTWIIAYCVLMSAADALSEKLGTDKLITFPVALLLSVTLLVFLRRNGLFTAYGLCRSGASAKSMLYYLPLFLMLIANLWYGTALGCGIPEAALYILTMLCVGFLEEVIFRGLLFHAMRGDNAVPAVIVSSVTFGVGHIVNLLNGSGAELLPNLLQVVYATAAGFMFVMIYLKTGSLFGCIAAHGIFNALSVFADESGMTAATRILSALLLTLITGGYALWLALSMRKERGK